MESYKVGLFIIIGILLIILVLFVILWACGFWYNSKPIVIIEATNNAPLEETINENMPLSSNAYQTAKAAAQMANKEMSEGQQDDIAVDNKSVESDIMSFPSREDSMMSAESMAHARSDEPSMLSGMYRDALSEASLHFSPTMDKSMDKSMDKDESALQGIDVTDDDEQLLQKDLPLSSSWTIEQE